MVANSNRVVFVHGLLGWGGDEMNSLSYWPEAEKADPFKDDENRKAIYSSVGPLSSHHDRACELFYQLMGGRCDYGGSHSEKFQHERYGKTYEKPLVPDWSAERPLHFIGHSQGVPTVRMLQYLLKKRFFLNAATGEPYETDARWVRSLSSVAGANNGTTGMYYAGCSHETGLVESDRWSLIQVFVKKLLTHRLTHTKLGRKVHDFDLQHWGLDARPEENRAAYLDRLREAREFLAGEDNAFFDLTPQGMVRWNPVLLEDPATFYFSYTTNRTWKLPFTNRYYPYPDVKVNMLYYTRRMGAHKFHDSLPEPFCDFNDVDWRPSDGALPTWAQEFPRVPEEHPHVFLPAETTEFEPGRWNVMEHDLSGADHYSIVERYGKSRKSREKLRRFYAGLFQRIYDLPGH